MLMEATAFSKMMSSKKHRFENALFLVWIDENGGF